MRAPLILVIAGIAACNGNGKDKGKDEGRPAPRPTPDAVASVPEPVGRCDNLDLVGTCTLMPIRVGAPGGSDVTYEVSAQFLSGDHSVALTVGHLVVPADRATDLERHYGARGPVPCRCNLVRPPCNPDMTWIQVDLGAPAYATVQR